MRRGASSSSARARTAWRSSARPHDDMHDLDGAPRPVDVGHAARARPPPRARRRARRAGRAGGRSSWPSATTCCCRTIVRPRRRLCDLLRPRPSSDGGPPSDVGPAVPARGATRPTGCARRIRTSSSARAPRPAPPAGPPWIRTARAPRGPHRRLEAPITPATAHGDSPECPAGDSPGTPCDRRGIDRDRPGPTTGSRPGDARPVDPRHSAATRSRRVIRVRLVPGIGSVTVADNSRPSATS